MQHRGKCTGIDPTKTLLGPEHWSASKSDLKKGKRDQDRLGGSCIREGTAWYFQWSNASPYAFLYIFEESNTRTMNEHQAANVSARSNRKVAGDGGFIILPAGGYAGLELEAIETTANVTFTMWEEDNVDLLAARGLNGNVIVAGAYLPAPGGALITRIVVDATVIGYHRAT